VKRNRCRITFIVFPIASYHEKKFPKSAGVEITGGGSGSQNFLRAIPGKNVKGGRGGPRVDFYTKMYYDFEFKLYGWWVL
jgi:hypothetical protein